MEKKNYISPVVEIVFLDNEISLALESEPPFGPDERASVVPVNFDSNPFDTKQV